MNLQLAERNAFITGSSGGIGEAIAEMLAREGCNILLHGRSDDAANAVAERIGASGSRCEVVLGDLTESAAVEYVASRARAFGVDILVNNAGPYVEHDWDNVDSEDWLGVMNSNVVPTARLIQALVPPMRERGWGRVINIGSRAVTTPLTNMVEYSAAKAAVVNMTTSLARHLAGSGITVNCVSPGVILTRSLQRMFEDRNRAQGAVGSWSDIEAEVVATYAPNPTGRLGRGADIAAAVAFLASPLAGYINGINLRVDGGITPTS